MDVIKRVCVTGGAGYVGSVLTPKLLAQGYVVTVLDRLFFGDQGLAAVRSHPGLRLVVGDIRDPRVVAEALAGQDAVIHLACIANDPCFELNPVLSKEINFDAFAPLVAAAKQHGIRRFIYASTSSVYGVSDLPDVTEDAPLVPLTDYNRFKGMCEPILLAVQSSEFTPVIVRSATVCGYSPRLRLDLSVNIFANQAYHARQVTVFGGSQLRPNIHIEDITDLYALLLSLPAEQVAGKTWNAGAENASITDIARRAVAVVEFETGLQGIATTTAPSNDLRSYHISSDRIRDDIGFVPKRRIEDAVRDLVRAFQANLVPDALINPNYYNIRAMKSLELMLASEAAANASLWK